MKTLNHIEDILAFLCATFLIITCCRNAELHKQNSQLKQRVKELEEQQIVVTPETAEEKCTHPGQRSLISALNEMQRESLGTELFQNKFTIPNYFINLVLKKYNMKICGE